MNYILNTGSDIPRIGLGTYKMSNDDSTAELVAFALNSGYRSVDCAAYYANECAVGAGIRASGMKRDQIFVTSKVWRDDMGYDNTLRAFEKTLTDLNLDYLDLYLLHWPSNIQENEASWRALIRLQDEGVVKSIGVSNFSIDQLCRLSDVKPAVNQIEFHPGLNRKEIYEFCLTNDILIEAWSPLARGRVFDDEKLRSIAEVHNKTVAQICLRWELQKGVRPIPKSSDPARMLQNLDIFDFELSNSQMRAIDSMDRE